MISLVRYTRLRWRFAAAPQRMLSTKSYDLLIPERKDPEKVFGKIPAKAPQDLLSIPLFARPHFPKIIAPIVVYHEEAVNALMAMRDKPNPHIGLFLHKKAGAHLSKEEEHNLKHNDPSQLFNVGVLAEIIRMQRRQHKGLELTFLCHHRIRWSKVVQTDPLLKLSTEPIKEPPADVGNELVKAYSVSVVETLKDLLKEGSLYREQLELLLESVNVNNPYHLADLGACLTSTDPISLQEVLEEGDIVARLRLTLQLLKKELESAKISKRIHTQIEESVTKQHKRHLLMEQLKFIKRELGLEREEKEALLTKFRERLKGKQIPEHAQKLIDDEMEKFSTLEPTSSEFGVSRNYLEWLSELPWGVYSKDSLDIEDAQHVLDEMHYGLKDVKDRILEFIAVSSLQGKVQGKILLLSGPPGVGKTSIGKSIAKALNREFYRFSVGGMADVTEIKGHRRTYIGSMPGKMVQALKICKTSNPVIMIDEIDKIGRHWNGDPASALLEALDPEQNSMFMDHYLDIPVDLSKVLFICTANVLDTIPAPLYDRMQSIPLSGYTLEEKVAIASQYLVPQTLIEAGLDGKNVTLKDDALEALAKDYCREAGVRNLKQHIEKIFRKIALEVARKLPKKDEASEENMDGEKIAGSKEEETTKAAETDTDDKTDEKTKGEKKGKEGEKEPESEAERHAREHAEMVAKLKGDVEVTAENMEKYVGKKVFAKDRLYDKTPVGIATGLAWTAMGGASLYIESIRVDSTSTPPSIKVTGQLGDVMKESSQIAFSYARRYLKSLDATNEFLDKASVHMHVPEGATPKDGPSAGCTMVSSLLSLALNRPLVNDVAMTGEVTLTGMVLPVGGIREKAIAAKRSGITHMILPDGNRKDWDQLPTHVSDGLEPHFVEHYDDVYAKCLVDDSAGKTSSVMVDEYKARGG